MVRERVRSLLAGPAVDALRGRLARASLGSFVLKGVGTLLAFAYALVLARLLGAAQYGAYEYVVAWVMILAVPAVFGLDKLLVRTLPAALVREDWPLARGLSRWATGAVLALSGVLGVAAAGAALAFGAGEVAPALVWIGCALLPLVALAMLWEGALRGLGRVVEGQAPIVIVRPLLALVLVVLAVRVAGLPATAVTALGAFAAAALVAVASSGRLLAVRSPAPLRTSPAAYAPRAWLVSALPIMIMSGLTIANARVGTLVLGSLRDAEAAGIYAVIVRGTDLVAFALVAVNAAVAPTFAQLHAADDLARFQRVVTRSARLIFALSLPVGLGLLLAGPVYLGLFGDAFTAGTPALRIVTVAQLVNVSMGSVGILLVMTGHERAAMGGFALAFALNVGLCVLWVPALGLVGAAWAAFVSIAVWNVVLAVLVYRRLGLNATIAGGGPPAEAPR